MANLFLYIYRFFAANRKIFFGVLIGLFGLTGFFALKIKPEEDISKILPRDRQSDKLNEILRNARFADKLVLMISLKDSSRVSPDSLASFSDSFSDRLRRTYPGLIQAVDDQVNDSLFPQLLSLITHHLPVFLDPKDYHYLDSLQNPEKLREILGKAKQTLSSPTGFVLKSFIAKDPLGFANTAFKKIRNLQYDENFDLYDGHIITRDERYMLLFVRPAFPANNTGKNNQLLDGMDRIIAGLQKQHFESVDAIYFGAVAVAAGNATQLKKDSILTLSVTALFLLVFISWYFKKKRAPFIILVPVVLGALFSLSMLYWIKGTISVIALAAGSIVLGIAINYSLHVYNHFRHRKNMKDVLQELSFPLTIGSLTTIGGFFCLQFVRSDILKDLGLFAAFSLIGASLSSLIFLPHLIAAPAGGRHQNGSTERDSWILRLAAYHPEKNKWLVGALFALTILFAFFVNRVGFDQDMMHLNYMPEKLKKAESALDKINAYGLRSLYLVTDGNNLQDVLKKQELVNVKIDRLQEEKSIKKYSGVFQLLISDSLQRERIQYWENYWTPDKRNNLLRNFASIGDSLGFRAAAFDSTSLLSFKNYSPLGEAETHFLRTGIANDYIMEKPGQVSLIILLQVEPKDKKTVFYSFTGYPFVTVTDKQYLTTKLLGVVTADFNQIGWMVSLLVLGVLLLTYGRIELALVSFIPMVIAFIWILGIMGMAGLPFNIVNIILSALIFGLGDDYSLFIMDGLLQEYKTGKKNLSSYKSSIVLSAITTLAGLGVLIFAKHPALRSIALISITGILSVVLIAQVLIPFFFHFLISGRVSRGRFPWTAAGLFKSVFSLSYFAFGSILVTVIGLFGVKWNPFAKKTATWYHRLVSSYTWSVLYIMGNVKKKILNPQKEDFSEPAVVIANHQSFLDILIMTMLYPKMILLTNNWVWHSPLFGKLVRMAGYYPVARGIEDSTGYLAEKVSAGFSIAVFPEGTRSADGQIKRFHKGAFFIAEKLGLDIVPVLIHGTAYTMSKGDFLLKDGCITIQYLPRVKTGDLFFGVDYAEKAKYMGHYFRKEYALLKEQVEQPRYFREQLIYNYIYKGPVLEWYLRVKIRLEKDYRVFHELVPRSGRILDIGCGYGFMSYMLQMTAPGREITGYDHDEEKIEVASHCFSKNRNLHFIKADITQLKPGPSDAIILSDVLHYLSPDQQYALLSQCMKALVPGAVLLIRDGDRDLKEKHRATRLSEFFSTKFFSFNKTSGEKLHFLSGKNIRDLAASHQLDCRAMDPSALTSNLLFVITHPVKTYEKV